MPERMRYGFIIATLFFALHTAWAAGDQDGGKHKKKDKSKNRTTATAGSTLSEDASAKADRFFFEAERAKLNKDWAEAIRNYKELLNVDPRNGNAWFQIAQIKLGENKFAEAAEAARMATALEPKNKWFLELYANTLMQQGNTKEAVKAYEQLIQLNPNRPDNIINLAYIYMQAGEYQQSIDALDRWEKSFGIDEQIIMQKEKLYLKLNNFEKAVSEMMKLVNEYPDDTRYLNMLATAYMANGKRQEAINTYKRILEIDPNHAEALISIAQLENIGSNQPPTVNSLRRIFENTKIDAETKVRMLAPFATDFERNKAQLSDALELAELLVKTHPEEAAAWAIKADLLYLSDRDDEAVLAYEESLKFRKDVYSVWQQLLSIHSSKQRWQDVLRVSAEAMEYYPNQPLIHFFRGNAEQQLKMYDKALKSYGKGEKMSYDNAKLRAQFFTGMGDVFHSLGQHFQSDSCYEKSLKLDADNAYTLNNYSYYLSLRSENLEKARQMSAYANKLLPDNDSFQDTYAWILFRLNNFNEAKEWQEKALKNGGEKSSTILEHYGDILFKLGNTTEAVEYWKKARELDSSSETLQRKIAQQKYVE